MLDFDPDSGFLDSRRPILWVTEQKPVPPRPEYPEKYPEDNFKHWYDREYAGWNVKKVNMPVSPGNGPKGKNITCLLTCHHPYNTAYEMGLRKAAEAFRINIKFKYSEWDEEKQQRQVEEVIKEKPDLIIVIPDNTELSSEWYRKINAVGIPVIASNLMPDEEGFKYILAWTGPDDFGQMRKLSRLWADALGKKGGVAYVQHAPGGSPYFARSWGPISELAQYAPEIKVLDMQAPGFEADKTMQLVSDWLTRFGDDLTGIFAADDSAQALGIIEALKKAGREDVIVVAAGNSKVGMDLVKDGGLYAITYQTAEGDGALAVKTAADWFNGLEIPAITNIPQHMITKADVESFYPPQW